MGKGLVKSNINPFHTDVSMVTQKHSLVIFHFSVPFWNWNVTRRAKRLQCGEGFNSTIINPLCTVISKANKMFDERRRSCRFIL